MVCMYEISSRMTTENSPVDVNSFDYHTKFHWKCDKQVLPKVSSIIAGSLSVRLLVAR